MAQSEYGARTISTFESLGLDPRILRVLTELGYEEPTPIQREAIPVLLAGKDLLGQAATGTGKTAAFALPLIQRLATTEGQQPKRVSGSTRALVLVPTRELAMQVAEAVHRYGKALGIRAVPIYGGQPIERQIRALHGGVDVVLATPGRALDHLRRRSLSFDNVETVVVDEADEMLDMGFAEDLDAILAATPATRQTSLFSATMPPRIVQITNRHLRDPVHVRVAKEETKRGELPKVRQTAYVVNRQHKLATLVRVLDVEAPQLAIVFCRTRNDVEALYDALSARGFTVDQLHGGMSQEQRDRAMRRFRTEAVEVLVATDVAARGLDVKGISHVVNFDAPFDPEDYIHRIGRTGRAGREGVAITLIEPREHRLLRNVERQTGQRIEVANIPTVADLRTRKLELTTNKVRESLAGGDLERFRVVVEALASEHDIIEVAMAAIKLAHVVATGDDGTEPEIPRIQMSSGGGGGGGGGGYRGGGSPSRPYPTNNGGGGGFRGHGGSPSRQYPPRDGGGEMHRGGRPDQGPRGSYDDRGRSSLGDVNPATTVRNDDRGASDRGASDRGARTSSSSSSSTTERPNEDRNGGVDRSTSSESSSGGERSAPTTERSVGGADRGASSDVGERSSSSTTTERSSNDRASSDGANDRGERSSARSSSSADRGARSSSSGADRGPSHDRSSRSSSSSDRPARVDRSNRDSDAPIATSERGTRAYRGGDRGTSRPSHDTRSSSSDTRSSSSDSRPSSDTRSSSDSRASEPDKKPPAAKPAPATARAAAPAGERPSEKLARESDERPRGSSTTPKKGKFDHKDKAKNARFFGLRKQGKTK